MDLLNDERLPRESRVRYLPEDRQSYCFWKHALAAGVVGMTLHFAVTKRRNQSLNQQ